MILFLWPFSLCGPITIDDADISGSGIAYRILVSRSYLRSHDLLLSDLSGVVQESTDAQRRRRMLDLERHTLSERHDVDGDEKTPMLVVN